METIKKQISKFKPNLSESSLNLYISKLKRFKMKDKFNIKIFDNIKTILNHLEEYPNISTRKSILTGIVVALQAQEKPNNKYTIKPINTMINKDSPWNPCKFITPGDI